MARINFWLMWWSVWLYVTLTGLLSALCVAFAYETRLVHWTVTYGVIGILMYVCDARYWVLGFYPQFTDTQRQLQMLFGWPIYYPYYYCVLLWVAYRRCFLR